MIRKNHKTIMPAKTLGPISKAGVQEHAFDPTLPFDNFLISHINRKYGYNIVQA